MTATVELIYESKPPRRVVVTLKGNPRGSTMLKAIDKAVLKQEGSDEEWIRWNLIDTE